MSLRVTQEEGRVTTVAVFNGTVTYTDVTTALSSMGLDLQQVADMANFRPECDLDIKVSVPVFNWPTEWDIAWELRLHAASCPAGVFTSSRVMIDLSVPKLSAFFHRCTKLARLVLDNCGDSMTFKNVLDAPCLEFVYFILRDKPAVWPTEFSRFRKGYICLQRKFIDLPSNQLQAMHNLRLLLIQGLSSVRRWSVWLTRGLYDPRLLQIIASFVMPLPE
jgi:hypothetical protein